MRRIFYLKSSSRRSPSENLTRRLTIIFSGGLHIQLGKLPFLSTYKLCKNQNKCVSKNIGVKEFGVKNGKNIIVKIARIVVGIFFTPTF